MILPDGFSQLETCHQRHNVVGDNEVDALPTNDLKGKFAAASLEYRVSHVFEHGDSVPKNQTVVIDRKNGQGPPRLADSSCWLNCHTGGLLSVRDRQP